MIDDPAVCDLVVAAGPDAPTRFADTGVPIVWDGPGPAPGVVVWGASPLGLTIALAEREPGPAVVALAHPSLDEGRDERLRFPDPVRRVAVSEIEIGGRTLLGGRPEGPYAAALVDGPGRRVTIVDDGDFMAGVALAAGVVLASGSPRPVWTESFDYLTAATEMGLVMAEEAVQPI